MTTYVVVRDDTGEVVRVERGNIPIERVGVDDGETVYSSEDHDFPSGVSNMVMQPDGTFTEKKKPEHPAVTAYKESRDKNDTRGMLDALFELQTGHKP